MNTDKNYLEKRKVKVVISDQNISRQKRHGNVLALHAELQEKIEINGLKHYQSNNSEYWQR